MLHVLASSDRGNWRPPMSKKCPLSDLLLLDFLPILVQLVQAQWIFARRLAGVDYRATLLRTSDETLESLL